MEEAEGTTQASIAEKLEHLENKVNLIDASMLETVGRKAQGLSTHLATLLKQKKQVAPSSDQEEMIEKLHRTLQKWDSVAVAIPNIVARLHALKGLQDSSLTVASTVGKMEEAHASLTEDIKAQGGHLSTVEKSFAENAKMISANVASLEARIEAVSAKMQ